MLHKDAHVVFFSPAERNASLEYNLIVGHTGTYVTATFLLGFVAMFSRSNLFSLLIRPLPPLPFDSFQSSEMVNIEVLAIRTFNSITTRDSEQSASAQHNDYFPRASPCLSTTTLLQQIFGQA